MGSHEGQRVAWVWLGRCSGIPWLEHLGMRLGRASIQAMRGGPERRSWLSGAGQGLLCSSAASWGVPKVTPQETNSKILIPVQHVRDGMPGFHQCSQP